MLAMAVASDFQADDRTIVPDWSLHWVRSLRNIWMFTGDRDVVAELLPVAERTLRWFESFLGADGLLHDVTGWLLVDWASCYTTGCSSTVNALWARALEEAGVHVIYGIFGYKVHSKVTLVVRADDDGRTGYRVQLSHAYQEVALAKWPLGSFLRVVPCDVSLDKPHRIEIESDLQPLDAPLRRHLRQRPLAANQQLGALDQLSRGGSQAVETVVADSHDVDFFRDHGQFLLRWRPIRGLVLPA